jgi:hypothetical protein
MLATTIRNTRLPKAAPRGSWVRSRSQIARSHPAIAFRV